MNFPAKSSLFLLAMACCGRRGAQTCETNNPVVQTFVGSGFCGWVDGQGMLTMFNNPSAVVADSSSNHFVLDSANYRIRKVTPDGTVTTFVGGGSFGPPGFETNVSLQGFSYGAMAIDHSGIIWLTSDYSGAMMRIGMDGLVQIVALTNVSRAAGICADSRNNLYISDPSDNRIHRFRTNMVLEVFAGSGNPGAVDGNGIFTSVSSPRALAADAADNI